jgi:hypothetical protein
LIAEKLKALAIDLDSYSPGRDPRGTLRSACVP